MENNKKIFVNQNNNLKKYMSITKIKDKMTFPEICNVKNLNDIIDSWDSIVQCGLPNYDDIQADGENSLKLSHFLPIAQKYMDKIKKSQETIASSIKEIETDYISSRKEVDHQGNQYEGRIYADKGISLINFPKSIRNFCLLDKKGKPLIIDLDIKNAHPSIWSQYLLKNKYPIEKMRYFRDYCLNRNEWIEYYKNIDTNLEPKVCIITAINGGDIPYIEVDYSEEGRKSKFNITQACTEIQESLSWVQEKYNLENLDQIKKFVYSTNTKIERKIINTVVQYCRENDIKIRIYAYDGICIDNITIKRDEGWIENLCKELSKSVLDELNYIIEFTHKKYSKDDKPIQELIKIIETMPKRRCLDNEIVKNLEPDEYIADVCQDDLDVNKLLRGTITTLKASMGLGKSQALYQILKKLGKRTIISILNRISLIQAITTKYDWTKSYLDNESTKINGINQCTVICAESLHRFTNHTLKDFNENGILILDELTSVLPQMMSQGTHGKNLNENQHIFWSLIRNAPYIFITDANISQKTLDFIKSIRKSENGIFGEKTIWKNIVFEPRKKRSVKIYKDKNLYLEKFKEAVQSGKKLYVPATISVLKMKTNLEHACQGKKFLYINQDNRDDPEIIEYIKNPQKWNEFDVVCISPTITSGISCDIQNYFDETWCFFTKSTSSPFDASQMIDRVRNISSGLINIHIHQSPNQQYPTYLSQKQITKLIHNNQYNIFQKNFSPENLCDIKWNYDTYQKTLIVNPKFELFTHIYSTLSYEYMFFQKFLLTGLKESYILEDIQNVEECTEKDKDYQELLTMNKEENAENILFSEMITHDEAKELEDQHKTRDPRLEKYNLVKRLSAAIPNADDIQRFQGLVNYFCPIHSGILQGENPSEIQTCLGNIQKNFIPQFKILKRIFENTLNGYNGLEYPEIKFDIETTNDEFNLKDHGTTELKAALRGFRSAVLDTQYVLTNPDFFGLGFIWEHKIFSNEDMIRIERAVITDLFLKTHKEKRERYFHNFKFKSNLKNDVKNYNCIEPSKIEKPKFLTEMNSIVGHIGLEFKPIEKQLIRFKKPDGKWSTKRINSGYELRLKTPIIVDTKLPPPNGVDNILHLLPVLNRDSERLILKKPKQLQFMENISVDEIFSMADEEKSYENITYTSHFIERYKSSVFYNLQENK